MINKTKKSRGNILIFALIFGTIGIVMIGGLVSWAIGQKKLSDAKTNSESAFQIAESGINYYRWHLAHARYDYQDGTDEVGPYVHEYKDKNNNLIGYFSLNIIPPPEGSTLVTVNSTGYTLLNPNHKRTIRATFAIPSLAKYAVAANDNMRFGTGTTISGPIHSNMGIRMDGLALNLVTSALSSYDDPDHTGGNEFAVHTHVSPVDPLPPSTVPTRTDVFAAGRQFPVPVYDFAALSSDLASIKSDAEANGYYFPASGYLGYKIVLKTDGTFDLYSVRSLMSAPSNCSDILNQDGWGTWSINTSGTPTMLVANYTNPANGLIFVEDNVWVEGQINSARLTIASARFPENPTTNTSITINNNLKYTNYTGTDVISLISQNNINVGLNSANTLQIDAALVAKNGRVGRYYYSSSCGTGYTRSSITLNGLIATNKRYGFAYTDNTGYITRNINYDANLLYSPPPNFPLVSGQYNLVTWEEVK